jgi:hypothetical protein
MDARRAARLSSERKVERMEGILVVVYRSTDSGGRRGIARRLGSATRNQRGEVTQLSRGPGDFQPIVLDVTQRTNTPR